MYVSASPIVRDSNFSGASAYDNHVDHDIDNHNHNYHDYSR